MDPVASVLPRFALRRPIGGRLALLLLCGALLGCPPSAPSGQLQVCAHQDDDLYFMNPAVGRSIAAGEKTWTVYLTAGDAGRGPSHWMAREAGMRASYASMAGVADAWTLAPLSIAGRSLPSYRLDAAPQVRLVFLRLPDGNPGGSGYAVTGNQSLQRLWEGQISTIDSIDGAHSYTKSELELTIERITAQMRPETIRIQDMTATHGADHSDHIHAGRFGFEAHRRTRTEHVVRAYRAYNIDGEPENLSPDEIALTQATLDVYNDFDPVSHTNAWTRREIALGGLPGAGGHLAFGGQCLEAAAAAPGAALSLAPCIDDPRQRFAVSGVHDLRLAGGGGLCVTATAAPGLGVPLGLAACDARPEQRFTLFSDGHWRGPDGLCIGTVSGTLQLTTCDTASRAWEVEGSPAFAATSDFSSVELGTDVARYRSLRLGDVSGDGLADACARRIDGVHCAVASGGGAFFTATRWSADFDDASGWGAPDHGGTVMLGDLDDDGDADLCARGDAGVWCALSDGIAFGATSLWTSAFSNADGGELAERWSSLRLGDVDGDGAADLCGHVSGAVHCARNTGAGFAARSEWIDASWSTALALPADQIGRTLMLGDIDGDGAADLCERGTAGVRCGLSAPARSAFVDVAHRSQGEFSDARGWSGLEAYWHSMRLADIDGNGQADLCGRGGAGLLCLFSLDGRFSRIVHHVARDFGNGSGWGATERGTTVQWGDIDGDGRADVCGAGAFDLECTVLD